MSVGVRYVLKEAVSCSLLINAFKNIFLIKPDKILWSANSLVIEMSVDVDKLQVVYP